MYYLRKEPREEVVPEMQKANGEVLPECTYVVRDRAIYRHHLFKRFFCDDYPIPQNSYLVLFETKKLIEILAHRDRAHEFYGEWFDVYDENGKVELSEADKANG